MRGPRKSNKPKRLTMINHGGRGGFDRRIGPLQGLDAVPRAGPWWFHERSPRHLHHLPRDYELAIRWLRPSFLTRDHWTPGRKGRDFHGIAPVRYVDAGKAELRAARSRQRAHVCVRTDRL